VQLSCCVAVTDWLLLAACRAAIHLHLQSWPPRGCCTTHSRPSSCFETALRTWSLQLNTPACYLPSIVRLLCPLLGHLQEAQVSSVNHLSSACLATKRVCGRWDNTNKRGWLLQLQLILHVPFFARATPACACAALCVQQQCCCACMHGLVALRYVRNHSLHSDTFEGIVHMHLACRVSAPAVRCRDTVSASVLLQKYSKVLSSSRAASSASCYAVHGCQLRLPCQVGRPSLSSTGCMMLECHMHQHVVVACLILGQWPTCHRVSLHAFLQECCIHFICRALMAALPRAAPQWCCRAVVPGPATNVATLPGSMALMLWLNG
jgi:hypothetical protein